MNSKNLKNMLNDLPKIDIIKKEIRNIKSYDGILIIFSIIAMILTTWIMVNKHLPNELDTDLVLVYILGSVLFAIPSFVLSLLTVLSLGFLVNKSSKKSLGNISHSIVAKNGFFNNKKLIKILEKKDELCAEWRNNTDYFMCGQTISSEEILHSYFLDSFKKEDQTFNTFNTYYNLWKMELPEKYFKKTLNKLITESFDNLSEKELTIEIFNKYSEIIKKEFNKEDSDILIVKLINVLIDTMPKHAFFNDKNFLIDLILNNFESNIQKELSKNIESKIN
jgi:hypothetical protein